MAQPDDLEPRVSALEENVQDLSERIGRSERDAAAARVLAGGADRDVAEIRGEMRGFRAEVRSEFEAVRGEMRDEFAIVRKEMRDYRDHNNRVLNAMRADMTGLREHVDHGFLEMRGRLDAAAAGQQQIVDLLGTLIARDG